MRVKCSVFQVKTDLCYVSLNVINELRACKPLGGLRGLAAAPVDPWGSNLKQHYVLPDFQSIFKGYVKPLGEPATATEQV